VIIKSNRNYQLAFTVENCCVSFVVHTEFLSKIQTSFSLQGLMTYSDNILFEDVLDYQQKYQKLSSIPLQKKK
jgi:hypothetical protein